MERDFDRWCRRVTERVDFRPDHKAIVRELTDHYEDHKQVLLDLGCDEDDAARRSLEAMGDADEVGAALNRVHKYWLGLLWRLSRYLLVLTALVLAVGLWQTRHIPENLLLRLRTQLEWQAPPATAEHVRAAGAEVFWKLQAVEDTGEGWHCTAQIWFEMDTPLGQGPGDLVSYLQFRDDQGPIPYAQPPAANTCRLAAPGSYHGGWTDFFYTVELTLDHKPSWVEAAYPYGTAPFTLRDTWEEGTV